MQYLGLASSLRRADGTLYVLLSNRGWAWSLFFPWLTVWESQHNMVKQSRSKYLHVLAQDTVSGLCCELGSNSIRACCRCLWRQWVAQCLYLSVILAILKQKCSRTLRVQYFHTSLASDDRLSESYWLKPMLSLRWYQAHSLFWMRGICWWLAMHLHHVSLPAFYYKVDDVLRVRLNSLHRI